MSLKTMGRRILPAKGFGLLLLPSSLVQAAPQRFERHFAVKGRPVVILQNVANGRIEVKSSKNPEVVVAATQASNKISIDTEQAEERIDVAATILDSSAPANELEANFQLTVPEETELQLKTQTGLVYVEQVMGDMTLQSVAGDIHLKEVSGYIVVRTTGGSMVCTQCAGKLNFSSISGNAQVIQPGLSSVTLFTMSGNILFDGDFIRTGIYTMKSGKGTVEVHFSGSDSFDLKAQTATGTVDNRAEAYLRPGSDGVRHIASKFLQGR